MGAEAGRRRLNRLAHRREETRYLSAIALNDRRNLGTLGECHTHAVDADVADPVASVADHEPPINLNRRSLWTNDLAGHDHPGGIAFAAVHPEGFAAILRKPLSIIMHKIVFEKAAELAPLRPARNSPIRAENCSSGGSSGNGTSTSTVPCMTSCRRRRKSGCCAIERVK